VWHHSAVESSTSSSSSQPAIWCPAARAAASGVRPAGDQLPADGHALPHRCPGLDPPGAELLTPDTGNSHGHAQRALHAAHPGGAGPCRRPIGIAVFVLGSASATHPASSAGRSAPAWCSSPSRASSSSGSGRARATSALPSCWRVSASTWPAALVPSPVERRGPGLQRGNSRRAHVHVVDVHLLGVRVMMGALLLMLKDGEAASEARRLRLWSG